MSKTTGIKAGKAYVELSLQDRVTRGLRQVEQRLKDFGASIRQMGTRIAALGAGMAVPLIASVKLFSEAGDQLDKISLRTGVSVESLSELGYAARQSGADFESLESGLRIMQRNMEEARKGSQTVLYAFEQLGLSVRDLQDLSPEQQFKILAEHLSKIEDPSRRAALAMQIFGRSGTQLLPLMADGVRGIEELQQQARALGLTISNEDAKAAALLGDTLSALIEVAKRGAFAIGSALGPALIRAAEWLTRLAVAAGDWIDRNRQLVAGAAGVVVAVTALGGTLIGTGLAVTVLGAAFGGLAALISGAVSAVGALGTVITALASPLALTVAGAASVGSAVVASTRTGQTALTQLFSLFGDLRSEAMSSFGAISAALRAGEFRQAVALLWSALTRVWRKGFDGLVAIGTQFVTGFAAQVGSAIRGGMQTAVRAIGAVLILLERSLEQLQQTGTRAFTALVSGWRALLQRIAATDLAQIARGSSIVTALTGLWAPIQQRWGQAVAALGQLWTRFTASLIDGGAGAIRAGLTAPARAVGQLFTSLGSHLRNLVQFGSDALSWLVDRFRVFRDEAVASFQGIADALAAGDLALAARILWLSLKLQWQRGIDALNQLWLNFRQIFARVAAGAFHGAVAAFEIASHHLQVVFIETTAFLQRVWTRFTAGFQSAWNGAINWTTDRLLELQGLFDSSFDAEAAKAMARKNAQADQNRIEQQRESELAQIESQRQQRRQTTQQDHEATLGAIGQRYEEARQKLADEYDQQRSSSEQALADARREWEEAIAQSARQRAERGEGGGLLGNLQMPDLRDTFDDLADRIAGTVQATVEVRGTFNAAALQGLMATSDDAAERTARATEETARHTKRIERQNRTPLAFA